MINLRPVALIIGLLLLILGAAMLVPAAVDIALDHPDAAAFLGASLTTLFAGGVLYFGNRGQPVRLSIRQAFLLTALAWIVLSVFAGLPFLFSVAELTMADAVFEAVSGLTTTGATILSGLDAKPPGLILWRSLLQWLGGIGIIGMAIVILPFLGVGGMQLFRTESSDRSDKALPRVRDLALAIGLLYAGLSIACALSYRMAGMTGWEAINHAMTTVSTAGFSTSDSSLGRFDQPAVHWVASFFMLVGAMPFIMFVRWFRGHARHLAVEPQVLVLLGIVGAAILALTTWIRFHDLLPLEAAVRHATLNTISIVTTTGFATLDYSLWGAQPVAIFFFLTFVGGCTGSTSGGIKMFRLHILAEFLFLQLRRLVYPRQVIVRRYGGKRIEDDVFLSAVLFVLVFFVVTSIVALSLSAFGLDFMTSLTGAASAVANVGPGLGQIIGPVGNYSTLPDGAKWILSFAMLVGRLELFTILILFTPTFWRR